MARRLPMTHSRLQGLSGKGVILSVQGCCLIQRVFLTRCSPSLMIRLHILMTWLPEVVII
jgi:hypothetical protein